LRKAFAIAAGLIIGGGMIFLGLNFLGKTVPLKVGDQAPDFSLIDQNGATIKLSDCKKKVVLAFYIKAFTPG
jgi:cytochrome oxidase Cu insertion factor (SCO1/SenC/PrrC family)